MLSSITTLKAYYKPTLNLFLDKKIDDDIKNIFTVSFFDKLIFYLITCKKKYITFKKFTVLFNMYIKIKVIGTFQFLRNNSRRFIKKFYV